MLYGLHAEVVVIDSIIRQNLGGVEQHETQFHLFGNSIFTVCYSSLSVNQLFWTRLPVERQTQPSKRRKQAMSEIEDPLRAYSLRCLKLLHITTQCENKELTERIKPFRKWETKLVLAHGSISLQ